MESRVTVSSIRSRLEKLDFSRFERDFQEKQNQLRTVYWNCVALDATQNRLSRDNNSDYQNFIVRAHESFLGCFYKSHELHQHVLTKFDGLHKVYRFEEPYNSEWGEWKEYLDKQQNKFIQVILHTISEQYLHEEMVQLRAEGKLTNLTEFDEFQEYLAQLPYNMFLIHLKHTSYRNSEKPPILISLPFEIDPFFNSNLQDYAQSFLKARILKYTLNMVDMKFDSGNNIISAYTAAKPKHAVLDLLKMYPEYEQLSDSQLSQIVRLYYRDEEGEELKLNSISKVLKRLRTQ